MLWKYKCTWYTRVYAHCTRVFHFNSNTVTYFTFNNRHFDRISVFRSRLQFMLLHTHKTEVYHHRRIVSFVITTIRFSSSGDNCISIEMYNTNLTMTNSRRFENAVAKCARSCKHFDEYVSSIQTYSYRTIKLEIILSICYAINLCMWYSISHWVLSVLKTIQIMRYVGNIRFETNMIDIDPSIFELNTCIRIYFDVLVGKFTFSKSYGRLQCSQRVVQCSYSKSNLQI